MRAPLAGNSEKCFKNRINKNNKKQNKKRVVRKQAKKKPRKPKQMPRDITPTCVQEYASIVKNPFDYARQACQPVYPCMPSLKAVAFASGTFEIGTAGFGGALMKPVPSNDEYCVKATDSSYTLSTMEKTGPGIQAFYNNAPFSAGDFHLNENEYRPVHTAFRYRYIGTELNRGGISANVVSPHHHDLTTHSLSSVKLFDKARSFPVSRTWKTLQWLPSRATDRDFAVTGQPDWWPMIVCVESEPGNKFEWEYVTRYEYIGKFVRTKTNTEAAPALFERLVAYVNTLNQEQITKMVNTGASAYSLLRNAGATPGTMYRPLTH